jgi:hypothetical protein
MDDARTLWRGIEVASHFLSMLLLRCLILCLCACAAARAHQVPNMTIEATFEPSGSYELKVNLDPRVFLSSIPTSLPPVAADWYLAQSSEQVKATFGQATEHLQKHVQVSFSGKVQPLAGMTFVAMDGATNQPVTTETAETHLLGTLRAEVPTGAGEFVLGFAREAQVSLILLLKTPEMAEPKVQVLFPGESSRAIQVPTKPAEVIPPSVPQRRDMEWLGWLAGTAVVAGVIWWLATRRKR